MGVWESVCFVKVNCMFVIGNGIVFVFLLMMVVGFLFVLLLGIVVGVVVILEELEGLSYS